MSGSIQGKCNSLANQAYACDFASQFCDIADFKGKIERAPEKIHRHTIDLAAQAIRELGTVGIR
ncbi:MAG TPA: hypothetical protein DCP32_01415 [Anaerolineaceae bacterium]|nr:MAG: hypothetical protein A2X24_09535 [Chloroflexi bacterium GWB2_54_36]HAL15441.1 hypothetical protein [Anaerolineaceae bacterium]